MFVHLVKKGETLPGIAHAYGVSAKGLQQTNGWVDDALVPGCSLLVPTPVPTTLLTYQVQTGDTVKKVANRFHMPERMLHAANLVTGETLKPGVCLTLPMPVLEKKTIEVNMRWEVQEEDLDLLTMDEATGSVSSVSVAYGIAESDGRLRLPPLLSRRLLAETRRAKAENLLLLTMADGEAAARLFSHLPSRRAFFSELRAVMQEHGFRGLHLELPQLKPALRPLVNGFVRELGLRVRRSGGMLYLGVPAHEHEEPEHPRTGAYDVPYLNHHVDRLVWNADEEFGRLDGPPMALAPLAPIKRSLRHALTMVPRRKLLLGLPFFGYDWALPFQPDQLPTLILHGHCDEEVLPPKQIQWDDRAMAPMFIYKNEVGETREVWYEDVRSIAAKLHLVSELGLAGISCLVHGSTLEAHWELLRDSFHISKTNVS
ncbi:spore germination protein YaaH [Tumebacillus sp. BK434]|uniref:LysM peptidoglycan-binding domain-containing protein n=1 Tax=Tumebacillus sp. BK434 TaxID=2512169 RepID=UPI001045AAB9|nr:LysM peptidoglycan-binding domain-containing protein [Tumebacillus sp. BK434]TCP54586.1 spore germination protein YaaH [Tumebacillus sp. BK434]